MGRDDINTRLSTVSTSVIVIGYQDNCFLIQSPVLTSSFVILANLTFVAVLLSVLNIGDKTSGVPGADHPSVSHPNPIVRQCEPPPTCSKYHCVVSGGGWTQVHYVTVAGGGTDRRGL